MAIEYKDYYEILGVSKDAGDEEIRRAFRRLARQYHPDKTGNDAGAENRFKEINEAYEVLGDSSRRRRYDEFHLAWQSGGAMGGAWQSFGQSDFREDRAPGQAQHFTFTGAGFSEFFEQLFSQRGDSARSAARSSGDRRPSREPDEQTRRRGDDLESDIWVSLEEVALGATRPVTIKRLVRCATCFGLGQYNAHTCERCEGRGTFAREDSFKVKIPRGIQEGSALRVPALGEEGTAGGPPGDLYLKIHFRSHPELRVAGKHLVYELEVAPWEAVLGTSLSIPTLEGKATIRIPAGSRAGSKLRLRGRGLPSADGANGDLIVEVRIQVPAGAREGERALWENLARECDFNPRSN